MSNSISKKQLREFGLLIGFFLPIFFGFILPTIYGHFFKIWTLWIGLIFIFFGIFKPKFLLYIYIIWMKFGLILGWINSRLILGLIFFLMLQPLALIMRFFGYDPLRKKKVILKSYRETRNSSKIDLKRIF